MSDATPSVETLEKQLRVLKKKLERSEWHRADLESQHDRDQHLYRRLHGDLEAANREAQIEASLERVRARAMAMRSSGELREMVLVILTEMKALAFPSGRCTLVLFDAETGDADFWMSGLTDDALPERYHVPHHDLPTYQALLEGWRQGTPFFEIELAGEVKRAQDRFFHEETEFRRLPEPAKEGMRRFGDIWLSNAATTHGVVQAVGPEPLSGENAAVLQRFARVIDLTYTRVEDIQQSEAQVREARIEAALERVRSRTMGMRASDELREVVATVYEQLQRLGVDAPVCMLATRDDERDGYTIWMANRLQALAPESYHVPPLDHPVYRRILEAWDAGTPYLVTEVDGADKRGFGRVLFEETEMGRLAEPVKAAMLAIDRVVLSAAFAPHSFLEASGPSALPDADAVVLQRVVRVFDQAYTRFLDLKRAEAQAREAQIEAAMERVRSRALAMTTSAELLDVIVRIHQEFSGLGLPGEVFWQTRYTPESYHKAVTSVGGKKVSAIMELPRDFSMVPALAAWEHGDEKVGVFPFSAEAAASYVHHMNTKGRYHKVDPDGITPEIARDLGGFTFVQARTSHGEIGYALWGETEPSEEAKDVLVRFTAAFDLAYRRFEDLQQAETNHRAVLEEKAQTERALEELRATQAQLIQSEKMASLGQLTAGIAHEIKNPLNFVNNFASLSQELIEELASETDPEERAALLADLASNAAKIEEHGRRADGIVRTMMAHARSGSGPHRPVALNALVEEHAAHAEHAMKVRHPAFVAALRLDLADDVGEAVMEPQEIGRVVVNLVDNALDAVRQRAHAGANGYAPTVTVSTRATDGGVEVRVADNGPGMGPEVAAKVFEPFFTTKPAGQGTGLGLSLSHDIVAQGHGGTLAVESHEGEGTTFTLALPAADSDR